MNLWSPKKHGEKLNYIPCNEARSSTRATGRGPAAAGGIYFWNDAPISGMDKVL